MNIRFFTAFMAISFWGGVAFGTIVEEPSVVIDNIIYQKGIVVGVTDQSIVTATIKDVVTINGEESTIGTIGAQAFERCSQLQNVIVLGKGTIKPNDKRNRRDKKPGWDVGDWAFKGCSNLKTITFQSKETFIDHIGKGAFSDCSQLVDAYATGNIENYVEGDEEGVFVHGSIGDNAFEGCTSLKKVAFYHYETYDVGAYAFKNCSNLGTMSFEPEKAQGLWNPDGRIGEGAFYNSGIENMTLPYGLDTIPPKCFWNCSRLTIVEHHDFKYIGDNAFGYCSSLKEFTLPHFLEYIGEDAFAQCSSLENVAIPYYIDSLKDRTFYRCKSLKTISFSYSDNLTSIGNSVFEGCESLNAITLPGSLTHIGFNAFRSCKMLQAIRIPSLMTTIADGAFGGCSNLKSISLPQGLTSIGASAFSGCPFTSFTIPQQVKRIGYGVFSGCSNLESISIPESLESIGGAAFSYCGFKSFIWPANIDSIYQNTFSGCGLLENITIPMNVNYIDQYAFSDCVLLKNVTIPTNVDYIGQSAFSGCLSLESISIPEKIDTIFPSSFSGCTSLDSISIPNGVRSIGDGAFSGCKSLSWISMPDSLYSMGYGCFKKCISLASITLPVKLSYIPYDAFTGCINLNACRSLSKKPPFQYRLEFHFDYNDFSLTVDTLEDDAFRDIPESAVLYVPKGCKSVYSSTSPWSGQFAAIKEMAQGNTHKLTLKVSDSGTVAIGDSYVSNGSKSFTIPEGESVAFVFLPDEGYALQGLVINGQDMMENIYAAKGRFSWAINDDTTVDVAFERSPYHDITIQALGSGRLDCTFSNDTTFHYVLQNEVKKISVPHGVSMNLKCDYLNGSSFVWEASTNKKNFLKGWFDGSCKVEPLSGIQSLEYVNQDWIISAGAVRSDGMVDSMQFFKTSDNEVTLSLNERQDAELVIPEEVTLGYDSRKYKVTGISNHALSNILALGAPAVCVTIPSSVVSIGDSLFTANDHLSAIIWNSPQPVTDKMLSGSSNPNLLLYLSNKNLNKTTLANVIVDRDIDELVLQDTETGGDFYCPKLFTASKVTYTHRYDMQSGMGNSQGWETIALPFDVKTVTHATKGTLVPFAAYKGNNNTKPFWLYEYTTSSGWKAAEGIKAYTPYIISMPNNPAYSSTWNVNGTVTFSASNVTVRETKGLVQNTYDSRQFTPAFAYLDRSDDIFALNVNNSFSENSSSYVEGSHFVAGLRAVHPFEAYMTSTDGSYAPIGVFDDLPTDIPELLFMTPEEAANTDSDASLQVMTLSGQLVREVPSASSLSNATRGLPPGVYIVGSRKVVVK